MSYSELNKLSDEQLVHRELQLERELIAANLRLKTGQLEDTASLGRIRKEIARARTAQRGREREQGLNTDALRNRFRATFQPTAPAAAEGRAAGGFVAGLVDKVSGND
ncbi:MAG: 50S ribosomal protein L29 [Alphaproteobacteria bacterium]|nr:50S ribosomal protein L29 [Alphaproteobacteria bacterium]